jgi:type I restriction enzyme M protein
MLYNATLKSLIDKLWNVFWSGGISNPLTAIEQITYLIFIKKLDLREAKRESESSSYLSRFNGKYRPQGLKEREVEKKELRWSVFSAYLKIKPTNQTEQEEKDKKDEALWQFVQNSVFPFIKDLNKIDDEEPDAFSRAMANAVFTIPKPSLLAQAIDIIEKIFDEIEIDAVKGGHTFQDIQGDVYEMLLNEIARAGKNGQFRTPRHIINLMAELVQPKLGQRIADPACGTSGFILGAYQYILTDLARQRGTKITQDEDGFEHGSTAAIITEEEKIKLEQSLFGFDIDTTMVRLGLMNLMMHGIDAPRINYTDTLSKVYNEENSYDIILANPPFTGNIDKGDIHPSLQLPTTKTELLFIERIFKMLKKGGIAAVIVPQGVLFGTGKAFVEARKLIVEQSELKAVITLPSGVFKPYAGVKTAILLFQKGGETINTWFYEMKSDGRSLDDKRMKFNDYGDLQDILQQFHKRISSISDTKKQYFFVTKSEIVENEYNLILSKYQEHVYKEVIYEHPSVIFEKLNAIELNIQKELKALEGLLK